MPIHLPFLSSMPKIRVTSELIEVRLSALGRLLNLGAGEAKLIVDSRAKRVHVVRRSFWFFVQRRTLPFHLIKAITYETHSSGEDFVSGTSASGEQFEIGLRLQTGEQVPLIELKGDAPVVQETTTLPLEWIGAKIDEALDLAGTQQEQSLRLVELLEQRLGVPLGA